MRRQRSASSPVRAFGKSTMLGMLARRPDSTCVIALVGERGREVREFSTTRSRTIRQTAIAIVSTGDGESR